MTTRLSRLFTLAVPVALALGGVIWFLNLGAPSKPAFEYETVAVEKGTIRRIVSTSGPVRALVTVSVGSYLSGPVDSVNVDFNSEVKPGDVLAKLDRRTFAAKVDYAAGSNPLCVGVGDFNGDAKPDLVVANDSNTTMRINGKPRPCSWLLGWGQAA